MALFQYLKFRKQSKFYYVLISTLKDPLKADLGEPSGDPTLNCKYIGFLIIYRPLGL
jgi:hypothetical protein